MLLLSSAFSEFSKFLNDLLIKDEEYLVSEYTLLWKEDRYHADQATLLITVIDDDPHSLVITTLPISILREAAAPSVRRVYDHLKTWILARADHTVVSF